MSDYAWEERVNALEAQLAETNAVLESIGTVLNGEAVSDFMLSFPVVRQVEDLVRLHYLCNCDERRGR